MILSDHWPDLSVSLHQDGVGEVLLEVVPDHDGESVDIRNGLFDRVKGPITARWLVTTQLVNYNIFTSEHCH